MLGDLRTPLRLFCAAAVCLGGCAYRPLSPGGLRQVHRPAFVSWIEDGGGPKSRVFREDPSYQDKLKRLDPKEADRRLQVKLGRAVTRFETSDRLRAVALANLPKQPPWTSAVDPAKVASALESFLVEEVPANPPDYELLKPLGADAAVEFVAAEAIVLDYLKSGRPDAKSFAEARRAMMDAIAALSRRVRARAARSE